MSGFDFYGFGKGTRRFLAELSENNNKAWFEENRSRYIAELPGFYFHVDAERSFFYGGQHMFPKEVLARYREAVADEKRGPKLVAILEELTGAAPGGKGGSPGGKGAVPGEAAAPKDRGKLGLRLMEEPGYKRVPRGYPQDHPRADLLRYVGMGLSADVPENTLASADLVPWCLERTKTLRPLIEWLRPLNE